MAKNTVLPGFGLAMGYATLYASLIVFIPLGALVAKALTQSWPELWQVISNRRAVASYQLTFGASLIAATINLVFGLIVGWVLVRYSFPGKRVVDALVDLPFALPTAVAGIALTALYAPNGWIGQWFDAAGIKVAYTQLGVVIAVTFIGRPFVYDFIGQVNLFHSRVEQGWAHIGDYKLPAPEHGGVAGAEAIAYVRPHDIELRTQPDGEDFIAARVESITRAGPVSRLALRNHLSDDVIQVDLPRAEEHHLQLQVGQQVYARPRASKVFLR